MDQIRNLKNKAVSEAVHVSKGVANVLGAAVGIRIGKTLGVVLRNTDDAKIFAKTLFIALTRGMGSYIVLEDFLPYFSKTLDAERAFSIFDKDGNGDISKREFKQGILEIYREHCFLETSLRHSSQAIGKLDNMLKIFMFIILLFICLSVFQVDTTKQMAALISIWVGSLFAIGGTIKDLVENLIFLFITHPYDTGDRVDIDGDSFTVKEFHLTTTILTRVDGKEIYGKYRVVSETVKVRRRKYSVILNNIYP